MAKNKLKEGDSFSGFTLPNQNGEQVTISPEDAKKRVVYFYPKNGTRVCTEQACSFRDWQEELTELGYEVIGISGDSPKSHQNFVANHQLNFMLLSDKGGVVRKQFGTFSLFGLLTSRKTFLINEQGIVEYIYEALFEGEEHINKIKQYLNKKKQ